MGTVKIIQITTDELSELINQSISDQLAELKREICLALKEEDEFITRKDAAEFFQISIVCLHDWMKKGIVKHYKMGNRTYFKRSELVQSLLDSNKKVS